MLHSGDPTAWQVFGINPFRRHQITATNGVSEKVGCQQRLKVSDSCIVISAQHPTLGEKHLIQRVSKGPGFSLGGVQLSGISVTPSSLSASASAATRCFFEKRPRNRRQYIRKRIATRIAVSELTSTPRDAPVVWVVLDQFPLSLLVNDEGGIAENRYPNFVRLANISTWYPTTSSIAVNTAESVPAALSGLEPSGALPVASEYPNSVFTLLSRSHAVLADEYVTQLCPDSVCRNEARSTGRESLWSDTRAVFVRTVLASDIADRFVPQVDDRWSGFGSEDQAGDTTVVGQAQNPDDILRQRADESDDRLRFQDFLDGFAPDEVPSVHYIHLFQPHEPLRYLPNGQRFEPAPTFRADADGRWPNDQRMMDQRLQQYLLQAMHADREVGRLLDRLEETHLLDDALIVVMSDHGVSMRPGTLNRVFAEETMNDLLPVPLFIKRPGQEAGEIDRRLAQQTDILPTVLDLLGVEPGAQPAMDGISLVGPAATTRRPRLFGTDGMSVLARVPTATESPTITWIDSLTPDPLNPFASGPDGDLLAKDAEALIIGDSKMTVSLGMEEKLLTVDPEGPFIPANVFGTLSGSDGPSRIAVAVNGTVAGVGSSFFDEGWQMTVVVDPTYFVVGRNEVRVLEVNDDGLRMIAVD